MNAENIIGKNANQYMEKIIVYLEQKYDEDFVVDKIIRRVEIETEDVILAQCHSVKYPAEVFDVVYHLSMDDIYREDEIINLLKDAGTYDESNRKIWEDNIEPYFEDNYTNVIKQHQFDNQIELPQGIYAITRIVTPNYYPDSSDKDLSILEYFNLEACDVSCYNYVFVTHSNDIDEQLIKSFIVKKEIKTQCVYIVYTEKQYENCVNTYYDNYEFPYEAFEQDEGTKTIKNYVFRYGE